MKRRDAIALSSLVGVALVSAALYGHLPDPMPTHFDMRDVPNGWMARPIGAFLLPAIGVVIWALIKRFPGKMGEALSSFIAMAIAIFMSALHLVLIHRALNEDAKVGAPTFALAGLLYIVLGLIMPRTRRNRFVGVRVKWTLSSDENWARTHRVAGYAMVIGGIFCLFGGLVGGTRGNLIAVTSLLVSSVLPVVYSYRISKETHAR